jgi:rubrerythrin
MRTSREWWESVKAEPAALLSWLRNQYHGEKTAAIRLRLFLDRFPPASPIARMIVEKITKQEEQHAEWIGALLRARGEQPHQLRKTERYWEKTLGGIDSFETGCAVAHHAEHMRLDRIRAIAADETAPEDIRAAFKRILPEEVFHERAFGKLAGEEAVRSRLANHGQGAAALGLVP